MVVFVVLQCEIISLCSLSLSTDESIKIQEKMKEEGVNRVENNERRHTIFHDDGIFSTNNLDRFMLFSTEMEPTI